MKNCDRGLENAARGRRPRAAFSRPRSQFFTIRTDPKPVNNLFFFFSYLVKKILKDCLAKCNCIIRAHPMYTLNRSLKAAAKVKNDLFSAK